MRPPLRKAERTDLDAIAAFHLAVWRETYLGVAPPEVARQLDLEHRRIQWDKALSDPDPARGTEIACAADGIAGLVSYGPPSHPAFDGAGEIRHLYVGAAHRRCGLGRALLEAGRKGLRAAGYPATGLAVVAGNDAAIAFYRANGGRIAGRFADPGPVWPSDNLLIRWNG